jgi:hypothetical protein
MSVCLSVHDAEPYNETIEAESDDSDDTYGPPFSGHVIDRSLKDDVNNEDRDDSIAPDDTMEGLDTSGRQFSIVGLKCIYCT